MFLSKMSSRHFEDISLRRFRDVFKMYLQDLLKMSSRRLEVFLKTCLEDIFMKMSSRSLQDVFKANNSYTLAQTNKIKYGWCLLHAGLAWDTYCVWYPQEMPFWISFGIFLLKKFWICTLCRRSLTFGLH